MSTSRANALTLWRALDPVADRLRLAWRVRFDRPLVLRSDSLVSHVFADGVPAVLKVLRSEPEAALTASCLLAWQDHGAVRLLEHASCTQLLERISPGTMLTQGWSIADDQPKLRIIARASMRLAQARATVGAPDVSTWGATLLRKPRPPLIEEDTWRQAAQTYGDLTATQREPVTVHGDLHHGNVLHRDAGEWAAIDPKGVVAEPEFDLACALRNPLKFASAISSRTLIEARLDLLTDEFGLCRRRLTNWAFCQAVLAAAWSFEDGEDGSEWMPVAHAFRMLL